MGMLIDSSIWVDLSRPKTPAPLKQFLLPFINDTAACLAEPVIFEVLRHATSSELTDLERQFATLPVLPTPSDLWDRATSLGQSCRRRGFTADGLDLLVAVVALANDAAVVTLDVDFKKIEAIAGLKVKLLKRP